MNVLDNCVCNTTDRGTQCTVAVHVDDFLMNSTTKDMVIRLSEDMRAKYGDVKMKYGDVKMNHSPVVNYLGMVFDLSMKHEATITMWKKFAQGKDARTPALDDLFQVNVKDALCSEVVRKEFHRSVARILYQAKRARPDCLTAASFLATRVQRCCSGDLIKLVRVMRYVRYTRDHGIALRPGKECTCVTVYIDAAYEVHSNGKSHTGSCMVLGDIGVVHCKSSKQGIVAKSSTEAELVALSDSCNQGIHVRRFLLGQGYLSVPLRVFQDKCLVWP